MKMDKLAGSGNDEFYTPQYAVQPLLKYLTPNSRILCPFDTEDSIFVKSFKKIGHVVEHSHISEGVNFFDLDLTGYDYIVSNPPYSLKGEVLETLFASGTPFAMLLGVVGIFESKKRFELFKNNKFEVMYLNKRVAYFKNYEEQKPSLNPPFSSVYICSNVLPQQIIFEEVIK